MPTKSPAKIRNQTVIVTGAAGGIGQACAKAFADAGAQVVAADLRFPDDQAWGHDHIHQITCDVTNESSVQALFSRAVALMNHVEVLVNCAGVLEDVRRTVDQDLEDWDRVLSVNFKGTYLCCREAGRVMLPRKNGCIVNVGSVAGLMGMPSSNAYGPGKAAVSAMTRNLAIEWARAGIRVNCVAPGFIETSMSAQLFSHHPQARDSALKRVPMRMTGAVDDIANAALFLCSSQARYITGVTLPVDGGWAATGG